MDNKQNLIKKVYFDLGGFGSIKKTLEDARDKDKSIKYADVKTFFENNIEQTGKYRGTNSYVAPEAYFEYQMDIAFFIDLKDPEYNQALIMIDIFTKYAVMKPLKTKQGPEVFEAFKDLLKQMNKERMPNILYTDNEGAFNFKKMDEF